MVTQGTPVLNFAPLQRSLHEHTVHGERDLGFDRRGDVFGDKRPATISGSTLTLTGATGTVALSASQASTTNYASATASTSFLVVTTGTVAGTSFTGKVQATGQPVIGASVQLYEAGTSGNGSKSNAALAA